MEPKSSPEKSVRNYHYTLRNNPEERSSHLLRGGSLKSHIRRSMSTSSRSLSDRSGLLLRW